MKGRIYTLLVLFATTLGWSSCSDEIPAGRDEGRDVTLTASFASDGMKTKAGDDQTISSRFVAAFRNGTCTGIAHADDNKTPLKIKAKTGDVTFIAIANANEVPDLKAIIDGGSLPKYADLKKITTSLASAAAFDPASFIKVTEEIRTGLVLADSSKTFNFRVFQLPAKIDVKIKLETLNSDDHFVIESFTVRGMNWESDLILADTTKVTNSKKDFDKDYKSAGSVNKEMNDLSFYTYERETYAADSNDKTALVVRINGQLVKNGNSVTKTYDLVIHPTKPSEAATDATNGIVHGWNYTVTGSINAKNGIQAIIKARPWERKSVDVEYGGDNSDDSNEVI